MTIREALHGFEQHGDATLSGVSHDMSAGNGSIMRLAPVPLRYSHDPSKAMDFAAASSRTTHAHVEALDACSYLAGLIVGALEGRDKRELLAPRFSPDAQAWTRPPLVPAIDTIAAGSFHRRQPPEIRGTGWPARPSRPPDDCV